MFCKKCGTELDDNALFCTKCGAKTDSEEKIQEPVTVTNTNLVKKEKKTGNISSIITGRNIIIAAIVIIAIICIAVGMKASKKINLNKYMTITYSGYNGIGTASWEFDSTAFEKDYGSKLKLNLNKIKKELTSYGIDYNSIIGAEMLDMSACSAVEELVIHGDLSKATELSNGDEVTFTWDDLTELEGYFNYKFKYADISSTVSGLQELEKFNPFDGIDVTFSGIAPNGRAEVELGARSGVYQYINYDLDIDSGLSNGDTVTLTASYGYGRNLADYTADNFGMIPTETTKEYTVEGLGHYVSAIEEIPETVMSSMQQQGVDILSAAETKWNDNAKISSISYIGSYLLTAKKASTYDNQNKLTLVFKVTISVDCAETDVHDKFSYYYPLTFKDLIVLPDETVSVDLSFYEKPNDTFSREYDFGGWYDIPLRWDGYEKLDSLFSNVVTSKIENYNYESTVEDTAIAE